MSLLSVGSKGPEVRALEQRLKQEGYLDGPADEHFGQKTADAVVAFKRDHGWDEAKPVAGGRLNAALGLTDGFDGERPQPKKLKGGTYNVFIQRTPEEAGRAVRKILREKDLDFLQLQEISRFHGVLRDIPGYKLITFRDSKDHGESGVLVRKGITTKFPQSIEAQSGWTSVEGKPAAPRGAVSVKLAGWLRVTSVHLPPAIDFRNGEAQGPAARVKSYKSSMKELLEAAKRYTRKHPHGALLIGGDWNEGPNTTGVGSPHWLARMARMHVVPGGGGIDWEMVRGAKVTKMHVDEKYGSDHRLVTFTVSKP